MSRAKDGARRVFTEQLKSRPLIIASACTNSFQLREWGVEVDVVVGNDFGAGLEYDCLIPLTLGPSKIIMSGGDEINLPFVENSGKNEFYCYIRTPIFRRMVKLHPKDLTRLEGSYENFQEGS